MLEFYVREQTEQENAGRYLEDIKNLAIEAGLNEDETIYERYVVNRFLDGIRYPEFKKKVLAVSKNPSVEDLENISNTCNVDLLLRRNVQHIWEKIFLSLDYESFKNCYRVCKSWYDILTRQSFVAKTRSTFSAQMWMDTDHLERRVWKSNKNIVYWTTNGEEVAFVERIDNHQVVHYVSSSGSIRSKRLELDNENVDHIKILRHVILLETTIQVCSVDKVTMKQSNIFSVNVGIIDVAKFIPNVVVCYLGIKETEGGNDKFYLKEVSFDHFKEDEWRQNETDNEGCCYSVEMVAPVLALEDDDEEPDLVISDDGSHFIYHSDCEIQVFSIDKGEVGLSMRHLWDDEDDELRDVIANAQYLVHECRFNSDLLFKLRNIKDGTVLKQLKICQHSIDIERILLSKKKLNFFGSYDVPETGLEIANTLFMVDLETYGENYSIKGNFNSRDAKAPTSFDGGKVLVFPRDYRRNSDLRLLDLTSGDPNKILDEVKTIKPIRSGYFKDFMEVKQGLCMLEVEPEYVNQEIKGTIFEIISWKGEEMPKALDAWMEWLVKQEVNGPKAARESAGRL